MTTTASVRAAVAAAVLIVPVAVQALTGSGDAQWAHLGFAASQVFGWLLLLGVALELRDRVGGSRWGQRLVIAGCALQLVFAIGYGGLAAAQGEPDEGIFVVFLAGFLALTAGGLTWGLRIRRHAAMAGRGLIAVAALGFMAMAIGVSPFHDVLLLSSYAAWVVVGLGVDPAPGDVSVSASSRSASTRR